MVHQSIIHAAWLEMAANELADAMIPTARLDAEIILAHTINRPRTWLHAHSDEPLDPRRRDIADARIQLRLERVPVAYIIGHKEFYGRRFFVSPATLIPRPDSEALIELLKDWLKTNTAKQLVDVGTGSGCLGITAALEHPELSVTLCDIDARSLKIAASNAKAHAVKARTLKSNLLASYPLSADVIMANLPYVDRAWETSEDTKHEPAKALCAADGGLKLIKQLIDQTPRSLSSTGALILEADPRQHAAITNYAKQHGLTTQRTLGYGLLLTRQSS